MPALCAAHTVLTCHGSTYDFVVHPVACVTTPVDNRHTSEVPLTTQVASMGVATLVGIGYLMLHAWESRNQPYTKFWQYQHQPADGLAGSRPQAAAPVWPQAASRARA